MSRRHTPWRSGRVLLLFLIVGFALLSMSAEAARWQGDEVVVRDYTAGRRWGEIIERQVEALNAALPAGAPRFVYQDAGKRACDEIRRSAAAISVCSIKRLSLPAATSMARRGQTIEAALILLRQDQIRIGSNRVCHELMHAATAVADAYHTEAQSCVRGSLETFGAWDEALLASEYGRGRR
jgi:hypothetical protein